MDEIDLISRLAWFGGYPEIKVADSCIQLLSKCQILQIMTVDTVLQHTAKIHANIYTMQDLQISILYCLDLDRSKVIT